MTRHIETITHGLEPIDLIVRADYDEPGIQFFTPGSFSQRVAYMKHPQGHKIAARVHNMMTRQVLVVRCGKVKVKLYASSKENVGSHYFKILEEMSMIEAKQRTFPMGQR